MVMPTPTYSVAKREGEEGGRRERGRRKGGRGGGRGRNEEEKEEEGENLGTSRAHISGRTLTFPLQCSVQLAHTGSRRHRTVCRECEETAVRDRAPHLNHIPCLSHPSIITCGTNRTHNILPMCFLAS